MIDSLRALQRELRLIDGSGGPGDALPPAQARALHALGSERAGSLAELAERTHTDPSSASIVVQRLVEAGLVARVPADHDRRRVELSITAAGRARLRRASTTQSRRLDEALVTLGHRQAAALTKTLQLLVASLRDPRGIPPQQASDGADDA